MTDLFTDAVVVEPRTHEPDRDQADAQRRWLEEGAVPTWYLEKVTTAEGIGTADATVIADLMARANNRVR